MKNNLFSLLERDLKRLQAEVNAFQKEKALWHPLPGTTNSVGNLALHLIGNLNHFIGAMIGNSGYVRDREKEFAEKHVSKESLTSAIERLIPILKETLENMPDEKLSELFPMKFHGQEITHEWFLLHLYGHLSYHLGQINYSRRYFEK